MVRFTSMCNQKFVSNTTEAWHNFYEGLTEDLDTSKCITEKCHELKYSDLGMGQIEGLQGIYPAGGSYGYQGYFVDFTGGEP